jgi:hypothetical protein
VSKQETPPIEFQQESSWDHGELLEACSACQCVFLVSPEHSKQICPICSQADLVPEPDKEARWAPELVLPIQIDQQTFKNYMERFLDEVPYKTNDLTVDNLVERVRVVWWPQWLVDADLEGEWEATVGYNYQVKTARERYGNDGWKSQNVLRTEIRYEPRMGTMNRHHDNVIIPALHTNEERIRQLGEYDRKQVVKFKDGILDRASIQLPTIEPGELREVAEDKFRLIAEKEILEATGAQHRQEINYRGVFKNMNWSKFLLPIFSSYYVDDHQQCHPVVMNAQSGKLYGRRMASLKKARKKTLGLAALLMLVFLVLILASLLSPSGGIVCIVGAALLLGTLALIPLIRASVWNRRQEKTVSQFR